MNENISRRSLFIMTCLSLERCRLYNVYIINVPSQKPSPSQKPRKESVGAHLTMTVWFGKFEDVASTFKPPKGR